MRALIAFLWISESEPYQVIINGLKRGVAPKHRYRDKSRQEVLLFFPTQLDIDLFFAKTSHM